MDRRTLTASLDILSQQFVKDGPFATELRTMAYAVSQMSEEDLQVKMAEESVEAKKKAKMVKCPQCGGKVLEATGYCLKCKKKIKDMKVKKKKADDQEGWSDELDNAVTAAIVSDVTGTEYKVPESSEEVVEATEEKEAARKTINIDPVKLNRLMTVVEKEGLVEEGVSAEGLIEAVLDLLTEDKSLMQRAIKWLGRQQKKQPVQPEKSAQEQPSTEVDETEVVEEEAPDEKKEDKKAGKIKGPGVPDGTGPRSETGECPMKKEEEGKSAEESSEVNTDVLEASDEESTNTEIEGIQFSANGNIDPVEMSDKEAARLGSLFNFDPEMTPEEKEKFDQLHGK